MTNQDALRRRDRRLSDDKVHRAMRAFARSAERGGLAPAAIVARSALAGGTSRAGLLHAFPAIERAVRLGAADGPATDQLLARLAVKLAG